MNNIFVNPSCIHYQTTSLFENCPSRLQISNFVFLWCLLYVKCYTIWLYSKLIDYKNQHARAIWIAGVRSQLVKGKCQGKIAISEVKLSHLSLVCFKIGQNSKTGWYYVLTRVNTDWTCSKTFSTELAGLCSVWTVNLE